MELFKIAWRNLWRSKTRTLLTTFVVFFVVILSTIMSSQQYGMYDNMIDNIIEFSGHLQIQDTNYVKNKTINDSYILPDQVLNEVKNTKHVVGVVPRIESFSLASWGDKTKGVIVVGIDPENEKNISNLDKKIARFAMNIDSSEYDTSIYNKLKLLNGKSYVSEDILKDRLKSNLEDYYSEELAQKLVRKSSINSNYLENNDNGVVIGEALAKYLEINLGDTLVMISQGYHGVSAANLFPVKGFIKLPAKQLERQIVFMDIYQCQDFYSADNLITSLLIKIDKNNNINGVKHDLNSKIPGNLLSQTWEELQPEAVQMIESDKAGGVFMKGIFYMIVGFIIFGTIMMMLAERRREFGILIAIGLRRSKLSKILLIETLLISAIGTVAGFLLSIPIISIFHNNPIPLQGDMAAVMEDFGFEPIIFFSNNLDIFYTQALVIFIVSVIIFLFPLLSISKLNVINAIKG